MQITVNKVEEPIEQTADRKGRQSYKITTDNGISYYCRPNIGGKLSVGNVVDSRDAGSDGIFLQQSSGTDTRFRYNGDGSINIVAWRSQRKKMCGMQDQVVYAKDTVLC